MSKLIKSQWSGHEQQENKVISIKSFKLDNEEIEKVPNSVDISEERNAILKAARQEADTIIAEANAYRETVHAGLQQEKLNWEQELIHLSNEAKQTGFETGLQEGKHQGYSEMLQLVNVAKQTIESSKMDYINKLESSEQTILEIGLKVAERILGEHLGSPEQFLSVVKRALKEARDYREVQLHINPLHYDFLLSQKEDLIKIFPKETELYIYPDADLSEVSCIIESANGRIDATVDQQLAEIKSKLYEMLESE